MLEVVVEEGNCGLWGDLRHSLLVGQCGCSAEVRSISGAAISSKDARPGSRLVGSVSACMADFPNQPESEAHWNTPRVYAKVSFRSPAAESLVDVTKWFAGQTAPDLLEFARENWRGPLLNALMSHVVERLPAATSASMKSSIRTVAIDPGSAAAWLGIRFPGVGDAIASSTSVSRFSGAFDFRAEAAVHIISAWLYFANQPSDAAAEAKVVKAVADLLPDSIDAVRLVGRALASTDPTDRERLLLDLQSLRSWVRGVLTSQDGDPQP